MRLTSDEANPGRGGAVGRRARRVRDRVSAKVGYAQLVADVQRDFGATDYYQGAYLINQAVNELCPAQIWQLRQSAGGYTLDSARGS